jgi:hypothetical protein
VSSKIDKLFEDEPTPPPLPKPPIPDDPPELKARLVSAIGGELRSYEHLDKRLDFLTGEIRDGFRTLGEQLAEFAKMYGPRIERIEQRQDDFERRLAAVEATKRRKAGKR